VDPINTAGKSPVATGTAAEVQAPGDDTHNEGSPQGEGVEAGSGALAGSGATSGSSVGSGVAAQGLLREEARPVRQTRPEYPSRALAQGWQGQVLLRLQVAPDGTVRQLHIEQSSGHPLLDRAASRAARSWIFFPARENGVPVAAEVRVPVIFASEER
jgi:protein TonB